MKLCNKDIKIISLALDYGFISRINALKILNISKYGRLKCELCGKNLSKISIDHIIPLSKGGTNDIRNLRLTHSNCNSKRSNKFSLRDLFRLLF